MRTNRLSSVDLRVIEKAVSAFNEELFDNKKLALSRLKQGLGGYRHDSFNEPSQGPFCVPPVACSGVTMSPMEVSGLSYDHIPNISIEVDKYVESQDISFFCTDKVPKGTVMVLDTNNENDYLLCKRPDSTKSIPVGVLLNDVVDLDLTRRHINHHKDEVQAGGKVTLLKKGWVALSGVQGEPEVGKTAYFTEDGRVTSEPVSQPIGRFLKYKNHRWQVEVDFSPSYGFGTLDNRRTQLCSL